MDTTRNVAAIKLALSHYWQQIKQEQLASVLGLLLPGIGSILVFYTPPLVIAHILGIYGKGSIPTLSALWPYVLLFGAIWAIGELTWRIAIHFLIKMQINGMERLYNNALGYLLEKDINFFNNNFAGSLTKKVVGYGKNYEQFTDMIAFSVVADLLPLFFIVAVLWLFSPWLVVFLVGLMSLTIALVVPLIRRRQKLVAVREDASNVMAGHVADTLSNMSAVQAFAREPHEATIHHKNVRDYMHKAKVSWDYQNLRIDAVTSPLYILINVVGLIVSLVISQHSNVSLQAIFITFSYYSGFTRVLWEFNRIYRNLESSITDAAQFTELLLEPPKMVDPVQPDKLQLSDASVSFRNVRFRYEDAGGEHLFKNFNLDIKAGEKVGLVGHSGGGKTTLTKLLLRYMDVDDGVVQIGSQSLANLAQADFRQVIAYVPQEPLLFHRSLADNIRYGNLTATEQDVKRAATLAHAHEFIKDLPNGYETLVGERGVKLSGGQRQRIAIARAMIKDAPILVLDEATSALDSESEKLIQQALWKLMEGRTTIVIAHRLSTIQKMDRIIVLEDGEVMEQGTHKELLEHQGVYADLWAHQSGGFLEE